MARKFIKLLESIDTAEGPIVDRNGRFFMTCPPAGNVMEIVDEREARVYANTAGRPVGLQLARDNSVWVADMHRGIVQIMPDRTVKHIVGEFGGKPIRGCNDCYFDSKGNLYFTAPAGSSEFNPVGELFCRSTDGTVHKLDDGFQFCNGLAVTYDDLILIVAETRTKMLWAYDIDASSKVSRKRLFATLTGEHDGGPDGLDFDAAGNLIATNWGGSCLEVFDSGGRRIERIDLPFARPSNVHFAGPDRDWLYVTDQSNHALWKTRWDRPGQEQYGEG